MMWDQDDEDELSILDPMMHLYAQASIVDTDFCGYRCIQKICFHIESHPTLTLDFDCNHHGKYIEARHIDEPETLYAFGGYGDTMLTASQYLYTVRTYGIELFHASNPSSIIMDPIATFKNVQERIEHGELCLNGHYSYAIKSHKNGFIISFRT